MPSNNQCREKYLSARRALNNIARSRKASATQRKEARAARTKLTREYIAKNIAQVEERTKQFRRFIREMNEAIESIGKGSPIRALETLTEIAENSRKLIGD
jgi:hypothetical protein